MHWTAFWANATSGASSCEAQSCKCSNEQWLDLFQETKKRKQNLGLLTCLPAILLLSNANYWKKLLESISSIWICTSLKSFTLLFVFLCSTTLELADLANCMYLYFFFVFFYATVELADVANWNEVACKECRDSPSRFSASLFPDGSVKSCSHYFLWGFWKNQNTPPAKIFCLINDHDL